MIFLVTIWLNIFFVLQLFPNKFGINWRSEFLKGFHIKIRKKKSKNWAQPEKSAGCPSWRFLAWTAFYFSPMRYLCKSSFPSFDQWRMICKQFNIAKAKSEFYPQWKMHFCQPFAFRFLAHQMNHEKLLYGHFLKQVENKYRQNISI